MQIMPLRAISKFFLTKKGQAVVVLVLFGIFIAASFVFAAEPAPVRLDTVDQILILVSKMIIYIAQGIGLLITVLIGWIMPVMQYNNFGASPVVAAGWAIVRDTVNMFFVIILIVIAFGTIIGVSRFNWQQQVPRLLFVAVVIKFSKTLSVLMIDIGQVVMLTFGNALKD